MSVQFFKMALLGSFFTAQLGMACGVDKQAGAKVNSPKTAQTQNRLSPSGKPQKANPENAQTVDERWERVKKRLQKLAKQ